MYFYLPVTYILYLITVSKFANRMILCQHVMCFWDQLIGYNLLHLFIPIITWVVVNVKLLTCNSFCTGHKWSSWYQTWSKHLLKCLKHNLKHMLNHKHNYFHKQSYIPAPEKCLKHKQSIFILNISSYRWIYISLVNWLNNRYIQVN